jgi:hypothetical protein
MLKRLAWLALCFCAPLSAAPIIDNQRLQQLANDPFCMRPPALESSTPNAFIRRAPGGSKHNSI